MLLVGLPVIATSPSAIAADGSGEDVTFRVGLKNEVDSFNPFLGYEAPSYEMWALTYDTMVGYSLDDMSPSPSLATAWETSEDGLTWTFDIREGVTWSDGEAFTAADIAYTYTRVLEGDVESALWGSYLKAVTSVTAPDDTTVVLRLEKPNATLPLLPIPILPEHVWKDVDAEEVATYAAEPSAEQPVVGTGPFRLVEGKAGGATYRFEANPDYWGGAPHVDQVVFRVFKAEDPMVQALIKGEVDFIHDISPLQVKALDGREGVTSLSGVSPYFEELAFNTGAVDPKSGKPLGDGNPALKDPEFRHALGYAIDSEQLLRTAYQGAAKRGDSIVPVAYPDYRWEPSEDEAFTFDLERAGELLDEAGYEKGADGFRTMPDGTPIGTLRLIARPEDKRSVTTMDFVREWLADLGLKSKVTVMESNRLTNVVLDGDFDIFHWGWYVEPDPEAIFDVFTCDQRGNASDSWYCNPEYDRLYAEQGAEVDEGRRIEKLKEMQQILFEESPYLVLAYTTDGQAYRSDRFACFVPQPEPDGVLLMQYGSANYRMLRPASDAGDCDGVARAVGARSTAGPGATAGDSDGGSPLLIGGGLVLLLLLAGGGFAAVRRRATAAERE